jgi:hypothetical protein
LGLFQIGAGVSYRDWTLIDGRISLMVPESYGGNAKIPLKGGIQVPKHDPVPLAAVIGSHTSRLGVVATEGERRAAPSSRSIQARTLSAV